jgi:hypothetical protein
MISRRKEAGGKPFLRVPIKKPVPAESKKKKPTTSRSAKEPTQADLDRHMRMQGMEQKEAEMMTKKPMKKMAKGGKVGKADGCAKKGKTHTKMVTMAMGGMARYKRGGKMKGKC